jgi:hypothetical protein
VPGTASTRIRLPQDATYQRVSEAEKALAAIVGEALQR